MRLIFPLLFLLVISQGRPADIHSSRQMAETADKLLSKGTKFASADLGRYKGHYTLLAVRDRTGSAEVHEHEADYFVIEKGGAVLVSGGKLVEPHSQKPGEIRGTSIDGGEKRDVSVGDVVYIPAGEPHQLLVERGKPITYFVVKVAGQ